MAYSKATDSMMQLLIVKTQGFWYCRT